MADDLEQLLDLEEEHIPENEAPQVSEPSTSSIPSAQPAVDISTIPSAEPVVEPKVAAAVSSPAKATPSTKPAASKTSTPSKSTPTKAAHHSPAGSSPAKRPSATTPTKRPSATTPTKKYAPTKSSQDAGSILIDGRTDKIIVQKPTGKYTKEEIEERVRTRNRDKAHASAAAGLESGETVFDRIGVKEGKPVKKEVPESPQKDAVPTTAASILITGREDKIKPKASPNKLTKEQIEEKVRARNREKARKSAEAGLASGETVFDRIGVKESPTKPQTPVKKLETGDALISASSRSDKIRDSPSNSADIEARARARAKAKAAPTSDNVHERLFTTN